MGKKLENLRGIFSIHTVYLEVAICLEKRGMPVYEVGVKSKGRGMEGANFEVDSQFFGPLCVLRYRKLSYVNRHCLLMRGKTSGSARRS